MLLPNGASRAVVEDVETRRATSWTLLIPPVNYAGIERSSWL